MIMEQFDNMDKQELEEQLVCFQDERTYQEEELMATECAIGVIKEKLQGLEAKQ